ncbi:MAG: ABC1 kinase family protein, partial [Bdellovibrionales bacterium]
MKTSKAGRLGQLVKVGAKVVGQSVINTLAAKTKLQTRIEQAKLLTQTLAELKGASMKFGQMLSIQGEHLLPPEVAAILSRLQDAVPAFSSQEMWKIVERELGDRAKDLRFEQEALAAASIGQVHRVVLPDETRAVLKIQYPGIDLAMNSEVAVLKRVLSLFAKVYMGELEVDPLIAEIRSLLLHEVDYVREGQCLQFFKNSLSGDSRFVVPQYYPGYSTNRVLCMSEESGVSFKKYLQYPSPYKEREQIGRAIFELYLKEFYQLNTVQTDPNFGNYLIRKSDQSQVVLLDFGATKTFSPELVAHYKQFVIALLDRNREQSLVVADKMGFLSQEESEEVKELFYQTCLMTMEPFFKDEAFDFVQSDLPIRIRENGMG